MSTNDPSDPRTGAAVEPEKVVVVHDETVVVPDRTVVIPEAPAAAPPPASPAAPRRRLVPVGSNTALWVIGFLVVLLVVIALFVWALAPGEDGVAGPGPDVTPPVADTIEPDTNVSRGLALAAPADLRTHTVNVAGDQDLLSLATTAGAVDSFGGAPVTADGVEVTELLGDRAFEVANPAGATMVVYLPYGIPNEVFVTLGQELTFVGSVSPTPEDLTTTADATAATAAAGEGAYVIAVPESVHVPAPSKADETTA
jgi:hypothetical protein